MMHIPYLQFRSQRAGAEHTLLLGLERTQPLLFPTAKGPTFLGSLPFPLSSELAMQDQPISFSQTLSLGILLAFCHHDNT